MKKKHLKIISLVLACSIILAVPSMAAILRASRQISSYSIDVLAASRSRIAIEFSIAGTGRMDTIGAESIKIYVKNGSSWKYIKGFTQDDTGMTRTDAYNYSNTIYYNGESGKEYKVYATVFAENSSEESDSRSEYFYVTAD